MSMKHDVVRRLLSAAVLTLAAAGASAEAPFAFATTPGKLPKDVVPVQYAAHLRPDVAARTFLGAQTVEIDVLRPTATLMLNAAGLAVDGATLSGKGMLEHKLKPVLDAALETLTFKLAKPLAPGRYRLALKYHGTINREARGLFHLEYKHGQKEQALIATNMAPADARRLMPLWDEPSFRARFKLTVDLPAHFQAYSNTPQEKQETLEGGVQRISFALTPSMPSYLLVLVAGQLERTSAKVDGTEIGVVTTAGKQPQAMFALASSKDLLSYYNDYFGRKYPLPKLDHIAIPGGFNGAMENWGGIVYDESTLLYDSKTSPESTRKLSFAFNAHEMAHQWFGNLVTMAWWDNLWLNEGFASWMEVKASEHFHPEWNAQLDSQAAREDVMNLDARRTTHAIEARIDTEEQAADAFDAITYIKGQSFVQMLEAWLGEDTFRQGVRTYLERHQHSNTTSADLWAALEKVSGKPVARVASDWTTQPGFPLLTVQQACEGGKRRVTLTQQQYWLDEAPAAKRLWRVPLELGIAGGESYATLLTGASGTVIIPSCDGVLTVDPAGVGYFRVQYDSASFAALAREVGKQNDSTRLRLLSDSWSLVQAGRMPLATYTRLLSGYAGEARPAIWSVIAAQLGALEALAPAEAEHARLRSFMLGLARPAFARLGWEEQRGESQAQRALRPLLAGLMLRAGDADALKQARQQFQRYLVDPASLAPSMRDVVLLHGARDADAAAYDVLAARAIATESAEDRALLMEALASAADPALAQRTLQLALTGKLPAQTLSRLVPQVAGNGHTALAWEFATRHREALLRDQESISRNQLFPSLVSHSSDPADADRMEAWVRQHFGPDAQAEAQRVGNQIRTRALQRQRLAAQLKEALASTAAAQPARL